MEYKTPEELNAAFKSGKIDELPDNITIDDVAFRFRQANTVNFRELLTGKIKGMVVYSLDPNKENVERFEEIGAKTADDPGLHQWIVFGWTNTGSSVVPLAVKSTTPARVVGITSSKAAFESVEIKANSTSEQNISQRHVTYDVYVDGEFVKMFHDILDAIDYKERIESGEEDCEITEAEITPAQQTAAQKKDAEWQGRIVGKTVQISFPQFGRGKSVKGKVDTGANISSLHAENIKLDNEGGTVSCKIPSLSDNTLRMKVQTQQAVKSADGGTEYRPVIVLDVNINGKAIQGVEFNLNDRSKMNHEVLVGHNILEKGKFIVDPTMESINWNDLEALFEDEEGPSTGPNPFRGTATAADIYKIISENDISFDDLIKQAYTAGIEVAESVES